MQIFLQEFHVRILRHVVRISAFFRVALCAKMPKKHGLPDISQIFFVRLFSILL